MSLILSFFSIQNLTHKTNPKSKIQISKKIKNKKNREKAGGVLKLKNGGGGAYISD